MGPGQMNRRQSPGSPHRASRRSVRGREYLTATGEREEAQDGEEGRGEPQEEQEEEKEEEEKRRRRKRGKEEQQESRQKGSITVFGRKIIER